MGKAIQISRNKPRDYLCAVRTCEKLHIYYSSWELGVYRIDERGMFDVCMRNVHVSLHISAVS